MTVSTRAAWHAMNWHGRTRYEAMKLLRKHSWQTWPGGDLPDEIPPSAPAEQPVATTA